MEAISLVGNPYMYHTTAAREHTWNLMQIVSLQSVIFFKLRLLILVSAVLYNIENNVRNRYGHSASSDV